MNLMNIWIFIGLVSVVWILREIDKRFDAIDDALLDLKGDMETLMGNMKPEYDETIGDWVNYKGGIDKSSESQEKC